MEQHRILVIEDDPQIGPRVAAGLQRAGFDARLVADGLAARDALLQGTYALVVLDLMLPGLDGFELLDAWRDRSGVPVIVLTARASLEARLRSFELGAIDWLPKPFFMEELIARVRLRLGMLPPPKPRRLIPLGGCVLDLDARAVRRGGAALGLTANEVSVLTVLATHPGRAFTRAQIADRALEPDRDRQDRTVDTHISRIRRKLGEDGEAIRTVFGVGYRLDREA